MKRPKIALSTLLLCTVIFALLGRIYIDRLEAERLKETIESQKLICDYVKTVTDQHEYLRACFKELDREADAIGFENLPFGTRRELVRIQTSIKRVDREIDFLNASHQRIERIASDIVHEARLKN